MLEAAVALSALALAAVAFGISAGAVEVGIRIGGALIDGLTRPNRLDSRRR